MSCHSWCARSPSPCCCGCSPSGSPPVVAVVGARSLGLLGASLAAAPWSGVGVSFPGVVVHAVVG
eukprot:12690682-Prorocentrum_lima.AAC.1